MQEMYSINVSKLNVTYSVLHEILESFSMVSCVRDFIMQQYIMTFGMSEWNNRLSFSFHALSQEYKVDKWAVILRRKPSL